MTGGAVFGLVWAAVGILLGSRWWTERARWRDTGTAQPTAPDGRPRFGRAAEDGSGRRSLAMLAAYAAGTLVVAVGLLTDTPGLLGVGALLVNLGTIFRFLVLALDSSQLESPVIPPKRRPARVPRSQPVLTRVLIGDLAK
jgi:hypothetical protein